MTEEDLAKSMADAIENAVKPVIPGQYNSPNQQSAPPPGLMPRQPRAMTSEQNVMGRAEMLVKNANITLQELNDMARQMQDEFEHSCMKLRQACAADVSKIEHQMNMAMQDLNKRHESNLIKIRELINLYSRIVY